MSEQIVDSNGRITLPSPVMAAIGKKSMGIVSFSPLHVLVGSNEGVVPTVAGTLGDVTVTMDCTSSSGICCDSIRILPVDW